jgi:hypothetical protein
MPAKTLGVLHVRFTAPRLMELARFELATSWVRSKIHRFPLGRRPPWIRLSCREIGLMACSTGTAFPPVVPHVRVAYGLQLPLPKLATDRGTLRESGFDEAAGEECAEQEHRRPGCEPVGCTNSAVCTQPIDLQGDRIRSPLSRGSEQAVRCRAGWRPRCGITSCRSWLRFASLHVDQVEAGRRVADREEEVAVAHGRVGAQRLLVRIVKSRG